MTDDLSGFSLMELFRAEAETHTATLSEGLLALEQGHNSGPGTTESMMRAAHSLKGAARIVGLEPAVKVAHAMEDCFVAVQEGRSTLRSSDVDSLLRGVDLLNRIANLPDSEMDAWAGQNNGTVDALIAEMQAILEAKPAPQPGPEPGAPPADDDTPPAAAEAKPPAAETPTAAPIPPREDAPTTNAERPEAPAGSAAAVEESDRVVKVTAESLSRLMSLAGESLVQSRYLRPFVDSLLPLKAQQSDLSSTLQTLIDRLSSPSHGPPTEEILTRAKTQASQCATTIGEKMEELESFARRNEDLSSRLHHEVSKSRMRPFSDGVRGFPRLVRDVAKKLGKQVRFEVIGENVGVDRDILEKLEAPLNHLIRNALDHAIESPEERASAGKPTSGTLRLEARHRAGMLQVTLGDDGRGVDPSRLRARIVERGLTTEPIASQLTEAELLEFLFLPGFSTKDRVTEISGRGVGLDVVQTTVRAVGGWVRVHSQPGQGTRFVLQLPVTTSVVRALLVQIAGEPYAFPLNRIERIARVEKSSLSVLEGRQHFMMDDQPVGVVDACQVLGIRPEGRESEAVSVVVASDRSHRFGVVVDAFLGERDLEVRPLDARLGKVPNFNSASILEDGWPVLIFDVEDFVRSIDNLLGGRRLGKLPEIEAHVEAVGPRRVLVVDDSITVRELERQLLESHGYSVEVAVDGLDGWNALRTGAYDLVISDVDMPRMDGIQLVTLIKQDARLSPLPVVIVSYKDREEDRMRGLDAGANAYLTKSSFHDQTFLSTVFDLIGGPST